MDNMNKLCNCGHQEKIHVLGVCAVLNCACVRRDLQRTLREDGTLSLPLPFGTGPFRMQ